MDKHDELCEKADVGSLCDCHCAGSKHAIKHTKGGVPGAGAVSKRAQGIATKDGRAAVVNNRAVKADPGTTAAGVKVGAGDISKGTVGQQRSKSDLQKRFPGAKPVNNDLNEGDRVTHKFHGPGTVTQPGNHGGNTKVKFDNGETHPVMQHDMMHGAPTDKAPAGRRLDLKPGALQLSGQTPEAGTRVVHETHGPGTIVAKGHASNPARVKFDNPVAGDRLVERNTLFDAADVNSHNGKPVPAKGPGPVHGPDRAPAKPPIGLTGDLSKETDADLQARVDEIEAKIKPQGGLTGLQAQIQQRIQREQRRRETAAGNGSSMTAKQIEQRDQARDSRLNQSQGRRARVDELAPMSREQFDALPPAEQQRAVADLRRVAESGDVRSTRDRMGIASKVDQNHIGRAKDLLRRFTAEARPAPAAKPAVADRFASVGVGGIDTFLKTLDRSELVELAQAKQWPSGKEAGTWKLAYLRKAVFQDAFKDIQDRQKADKGITSGGKGGPDAAMRDVMAVTSRRRNGDTSAEIVAKPAPGAPTGGPDKSERVRSSTRGGPVTDTAAKSPDLSTGSKSDQRDMSKTKAVFHGTGAELVHAGNVSEGDKVTHVRDGVGTVTKVGQHGGPHTVKFDGATRATPVMGQHLVTGAHPRHAADNAAGEKAADQIIKQGEVGRSAMGMTLGEQAATVLELQRRADVYKDRPATAKMADTAATAAKAIRRMGADRVLESGDADTSPIKADDQVTAGFTKGKVIRLERRRGIDGAVVQLVKGGPDEGTLPHWVPLSGIKKHTSRPAWG